MMESDTFYAYDGTRGKQLVNNQLTLGLFFFNNRVGVWGGLIIWISGLDVVSCLPQTVLTLAALFREKAVIRRQ